MRVHHRHRAVKQMRKLRIRQVNQQKEHQQQMDEIPAYPEDMLYDIETQIASGFNWGAILLENLIILPVFCLVGAMIARVFINKNVSER